MAIDYEYRRVVHHGGRTFRATTTMADIFAAHARDIIARGDTELVPLLHSSGVDLLLIGPGSGFSITVVETSTARP
ncbi:hypothetical protein [Herbiconiux solani]|uniref:hypothetical protein n=1 Tax=Herbiconiux solani TaxID=661329 RepID=UPI0012ED78B2|nr:hypothetical protein [Herbiconiux solani]